jgi:hypothetical protein
MKRIIVILLALSLLPTSAVLLAKPDKADKQNNPNQYGSKRNYHAYQKQKPPKGWRKKLIKGQPVAPDLVEYLEDVSREIVKTLPPLPPGVSYKRIEGDIIKIHNANMEILEVIRDLGVPVPVLPKIK